MSKGIDIFSLHKLEGSLSSKCNIENEALLANFSLELIGYGCPTVSIFEGIKMNFLLRFLYLSFPPHPVTGRHRETSRGNSGREHKSFCCFGSDRRAKGPKPKFIEIKRKTCINFNGLWIRPSIKMQDGVFVYSSLSLMGWNMHGFCTHRNTSTPSFYPLFFFISLVFKSSLCSCCCFFGC